MDIQRMPLGNALAFRQGPSPVQATPLWALPQDRFVRASMGKSAVRFSGHIAQPDEEAQLAKDHAFSELIRSGNVEQVRNRIQEQQLQDDPIDLNTPGLDGQLPLCVAAWSQSQEMIQLLFQEGATPNHADDQGQTPLIIAVTTKNPQSVRAMLDAGADANQADPTGEAPIHIASRVKDPTILEMLIKANADVNQPDGNQETGLHCAADRANVSHARLLLNAKAQAGRVNCCGQTPLDIALDNFTNPAVHNNKKHRLKMIRVLLPHGGPAAPRLSSTGQPVEPDPEIVQNSLDNLAKVLTHAQKQKQQAEQLIHLIAQQDTTM